MLINAIIYYIVESFCILVLCYDTLGFILAYNKNQMNESEKLTDYKRLVSSWVYLFSLMLMRGPFQFIPLMEEIILLLLILFTIPALHGAEKATDCLFSRAGIRKTTTNLIEMIAPKKKNLLEMSQDLYHTQTSPQKSQ